MNRLTQKNIAKSTNRGRQQRLPLFVLNVLALFCSKTLAKSWLLIGLRSLFASPAALLCVLFLACCFLLPACSDSQETDSELLEQARESFTRKEYLDAEKLYERFLRYVPESEDRFEAWDKVAYIAMNVRHDENLTADIMEVMALEYTNVPRQYQEILERLAVLYEANYRWDRAKNTYERMLRIPNLSAAQKGQAFLHLARIHQAKLDYQTATEYLENCLALELPENIKAEALYALAMVYADQAKSKLAEEKLLEITLMGNAPENIKVQSLFMLADLQEEQGKLKEALRLFSSIAKTYPNPEAVAVRIEGLNSRIKAGPVVKVPESDAEGKNIGKTRRKAVNTRPRVGI